MIYFFIALINLCLFTVVSYLCTVYSVSFSLFIIQKNPSLTMSGYARNANSFSQRPYQTSSAVGGDAAMPAVGSGIRPADEAAGDRLLAMNNVAKGTLDPGTFLTAPVAHKHPQVQRITMKESNTLKVVQFPAPYTPQEVVADSGTGVILVDWKRAPSTGFYHMGILNAGGLWDHTTASGAGSDLRNFVSYSNQVNLRSGIHQIQNSKACALPYSKASGRQLRVLSTNIARDYMFARNYSGRLSIISDTVQLNAAVAAGNVTASVINDTQSVAQNADGSDCYSVSDIVNGARWKNETVQAYSLMDGVTILQGPDIPEELGPIDQVNRNFTDGAWQSIAGQVGFDVRRIASTALNPATTGAGGYNAPAFGFWISPSGWTVYDQLADSLINGYNVNNAVPQIPEMSMLSVRIRAPFWLTSSTNAMWTNDNGYTATLVIEHVFASLGPNGELRLDSIADVKQCGNGTMNSLLLGQAFAGQNIRAINSNAGMIDVTSDPRSEYIRRRNNGNDPGKYIGSKVNFFFMPVWSTNTGPTATLYIGGNDAYAASTHCENIVEVCAVDVNTDASGPFDVIRYDDVAIGQNIRINTCINIETVARAAFSILSPSDMYDTCYDFNIYALLNSLYFGPQTDFRCVWTNANYRKILGKLQNWSITDLQHSASMTTESRQIAEAAGLFDGLKKFGTNLFHMGRRALNNPMIRNLAMNAIDAGVNHMSRRAQDLISQSGDTEGGEATGSFGDQQWLM